MSAQVIETHLNIDWHEHKTPLRIDVLCLILAMLMHAPLNLIKVDARKKAIDSSKSRLSEVVMIDQIEEKKDIPVPEPVASQPKGPSLADRLKALVKKDPPPPPPPPKLPIEAKKIPDIPQPIALQPNLKAPAPVSPALQAKEGFKTKLDPTVVENKISLKSAGAGIAPLSAKALGTIENRAELKTGKAGFKIAQAEKIDSIGGGKGIADPSGPRIAIQTSKTSMKEGFSAPPPQKLDKGTLGSVSGAGLSNAPVGLRDKIIMRDAGVGQINTSGARAGIASSGGAVVATKQNAGSFQGGTSGGVAGGVAGGVVGGVVGGSLARGPSAAPVKKKKEMFQLTGELKDRARLHQEVPQYPAWAEQKGIEAAVVLQFSVEANGIVKDAIVVLRTSGYPELDELAKKALRKWKFVPLADGENRVEVGTITFNYTLN